MVTNIDPYIGGTERVTQTIAEGLQNRGFNTFFIFPFKDNKIISSSRKLKFNSEDTVALISNLISSFLNLNSIKVLVVVNRMFHSVKYQKIFSNIKIHSDVKIIASLHAAPDNWVNKNKWGLVLPKVYIKECIKSLLYKIYNPHIKNVVGTYNVADKFLLLSESYKKSFETTYGISDTQIKLMAIPNPCPFTDIYENEEKENIVLIVSRMQEDQKRIYAALVIWKTLENSIGSWRLVIVGNGPDINTYKKYAKQLKNVEFVGHSNDVQSYYKKSKIFMMTSIWEGLPMTLIESIHYGCVPIVFDSFAAVHDIIEDGVTGYIIKNNASNEFSSKLSCLMKNNSMLNKMQQNILEKENLFTLDKILSVWKKELIELIK